MMKKNGVTLAELIVVILIIFILAGAGMQFGRRSAEVGRGKAARATLQAIYAAEREYCIHYGIYVDLATTLVDNGYIADPNDPDQTNWNYTTPAPSLVPNPADPNDCGSYIAQARRIWGQNLNETITIDEGGVYGGTFDPD